MKRSFAKRATNENNTAIPVGLALQGGGAYGAFTKGALKALLESGLFTPVDGKAEIKAITGTSAGAMNGLMLAHGLNTGGAAQAIKNLDDLWDDAGKGMRLMKRLSPPLRAVTCMTWPNIPQCLMDFSLAVTPKGFVTGLLKRMLDRRIGEDWAAVQDGKVKLFVNAVREDPQTGERDHRVFTGKTLTGDAFAAAGALEALGPHKVDGVDHYDGGYWRNPCFEDIEREPITDMIIITIMERPEHPVTPVHQDDLRAQHERPGRMVMKTELHHHLAWMEENRKDLHLHVISLDVDKCWDDTSRMNTDPRWLSYLEKKGYEAARQWLAVHSDALGKRSSYRTENDAGRDVDMRFAM